MPRRRKDYIKPVDDEDDDLEIDPATVTTSPWVEIPGAPVVVVPDDPDNARPEPAARSGDCPYCRAPYLKDTKGKHKCAQCRREPL